MRRPPEVPRQRQADSTKAAGYQVGTAFDDTSRLGRGADLSPFESLGPSSIAPPCHDTLVVVIEDVGEQVVG